MNKKIIVFICILSLLVPFLPQFDFVVCADVPTDIPSVSEDYAEWIDENFYVNDFGVLLPKSQAPLYKKINWALTDAGYVLKDPVSAIVDSLQSATNLQLLTKENLIDYGSSINYDYSSLSQNIVNYSIDYASSHLTYLTRTTVHVSDFLTLLSPIAPGANTTRANNCFNALKPIVNGSSSNVYIYTEPWHERFFILPVLYAIDRDDFVNFSFYVTNNANLNDKYKLNGDGIVDFGSSNSNNPGFSSPVSMWVVSGNQIISDLTVFRSTFSTSSGFSSPSNFSVNYNTSFFAVGFGKWVYSNLNNQGGGSFFIISDSLDNFQFPVFLDSASVQSFYTGSAPVYKFDSDLDLSQFGNDIDYSRLYDIISIEVRHSSGNVLNAIDNVANNYLQQQIDLLHDINNALNSPSGESWLHMIYNLLDYNFPLTLQAFEDLQQAIQNISISGGGSDLSHINRVLDEINAKLGFMIEEPLTDADIQDMEDLKTLAQQKFPFCVFSDIVAISVILNQTPEQPHWQIPFKLPGSESVNNIEVDLSWYEDVRDLVQGVFIFIFIVGLLALSVKVFSALKS